MPIITRRLRRRRKRLPAAISTAPGCSRGLRLYTNCPPTCAAAYIYSMPYLFYHHAGSYTGPATPPTSTSRHLTLACLFIPKAEEYHSVCLNTADGRGIL